MRRRDRRPLFSGALLAASLACLSCPRPVAAQPPVPPSRSADRRRGAYRAAPGRRRRRARRPRLGGGPAPDRLLADGAGRGRPGLRADRGPHRLHGRHALLRRRVPRLRPGRHRGQRQPPRLAARRDGRLPDHPRHLPRPPERLRLRHEPRRPRVRRASDERGPGRRGERRPGGGGRVADRLQPELGRGVGREDAQRRLRLERRVRHPVHDAALRTRERPRVGPEPAAQRPPPQRELVLGAAAPPVRPVPALAGGRPRGPAAPAAAEPQAAALRARGDHRETGARADPRDDGRNRWRPQVERHAQPRPRRDGEHRLRAGRSRRAAGEPRPLQPLLPGEAALLPRERGPVHARLPGRGRPLLLAPDRDRAGRRCGPDRRGRAPLGQARRLQRGPPRHADAQGRHAGADQQLRRGPRLARAAEPLAGGRHLREPRGHRRSVSRRRPQPRRTGRTAAGASAATVPSRATSRRRRRRASKGATHAFNLGANLSSPAWELNAEYTEVGRATSTRRWASSRAATSASPRG